MASTADNLYITYVETDCELLKIWGQRKRIGATYIERQLLQLLPDFERSLGPNPTQIHKGMFCFAKYTDGNYYRARVISRVQGDSVGVLFIDYGNRDIIKLSNIRIQDGNESDVLAKMSEQAEEYYLSGVASPPGGWSKEIVSKIRSDICYEEFPYQIVATVGDQKIVEIQFRNENFSNYLVKKQLASPLSLPVQRHTILTYCSLVTSDGKPENALSDNSKVVYSPSIPPPNMRVPLPPSSGGIMQMNYDKTNNAVNFSVPPPGLQYSSPRHVTSTYQQMIRNIPKNQFFPTANHHGSQIPVNNNPSQLVNPVLNPLLSHNCNPLYQMKENADLINSNNNIIQILAEQVKQYIDEDKAKSESKEENSPYHYVNSVLEVGNTYSVVISYISDGPWSFSIQLLSSETELQKLMDELSSIELVPIKPPIILGLPCIAPSALYGNLCRGVVVSISHSAVKVYFVDFGNTEDLPSSSIYKLPSKFFKIRVLSQKFSLSGLQKVAYSDDIKKFFKEVVLNEILMLRVISLEDDNLPTCELYLKDKNIKRILNEKIRELKNSSTESFPKVGDTESVIVTWVINPLKFFVQLNKRDAELKALKEELAGVDTKGQRLTYQELFVGFKCVCQYETDGQWYRAVITSMDSEHAIRVFYVDYGNTETVSISLLRKINSSGLINQMDNQAIQCGLSAFENKPVDEELANKFEVLTLEKQLQMSVVASEKECLSVQLFQNGQDVSELLLSAASSEEEVPEKSSQRSDDVWSSSSQRESNVTSAFEKENQFSEKTEIHESKDARNFRGVKSREKSNSKAFDDTKNIESTVWSTYTGSRKRFENRDSLRNDKDREIHWKEQKSDNQNSWQSHSLKQNKEYDDWNNNTNSKFGGSREPRSDRGHGGDRGDSFRFERSWGFRQDSNNFSDKKKWEENRGGRERFDERKFSAREGKRFDGSRIGGDSSRRDNFSRKIDRSISTFSGNDKSKSSRKPMRREDIAPPGSKFQERILQLGSCEKGIVTYYFSPHEFYVQLLTQNEEFRKMMKDIQVYYSDKYPIRDPVKAGDIVIAQFSLDKVLYRAEIVKPSPVTVRYVDYGNQEPIGSRATWFVNKQFLNLPKQVIKCRLSNIQPMGSDWPPPGSAVDKFFEFEKYNCTFVGLEGDMYEISMENVENGKDIAREIIAAGLGRPVSPTLGIPEIDYSLLPNQVLRLYVSHIESPSKFYVIINPKGLKAIENELKTLSENEKNLIPLSEDLMNPGVSCLSTNDNVSWYRGSILKTDKSKISVWFSDRGDTAEVSPHQVMCLPDYLKDLQPQAVQCSLDGVSNINEEEFKKEFEFKHNLVSVKDATDGRLSVVLYNDDGLMHDFHECEDSPYSIEPVGELPIISQKLQILVSHMKSPKEIYIQSAHDRDEFVKFTELISSFYSEEKTNFDVGEKEIEGPLVAAKSFAHKSWCRGRLLSAAEDGVSVFYIDYGNEEVLPRENVKKLDPSFLEFNAFSKKLILDVEFDVDKTQEINNRVLELCQGKELLAHFKGSEDGLASEITVNGVKITDLLKSEGLLATEKEDKLDEILSNEKAETVSRKSSICDAHEEKPNGLKVFVRHIDSPEQFWVQKESTIADLHELQDRLQKSCETVPSKENIEADDLVAAWFCDKWYRAKVAEVDNDKATVQFIDYGNTVRIDLTRDGIKQLADEFISVPAFATPYALKGSWSEDLTVKFEDIILQDEDPVEVVILEGSETGRVVVDLLQNGRSVTEMLLEEGGPGFEEEKDLATVYITHLNSPDDFYVQRESCTSLVNRLNERLSDASRFGNPSSVEEKKMYAAKFPDDKAWYRAVVNKRKGNEFEVHFIDYGNTSNVSDIKCLPNDLTDIPNLAENYCLLYGRKSDSWSDAACEKFAEYADGRALKMKVVVNRVKKPVVELFYENKNITEELESLCKSDERLEVHVTHALSPTDFYIKYVNDTYYELIEKTLESDIESGDLEDNLPGTLCQACFTDDGCWYRAKILKNLGGRYEVFFVDFGNISVSENVKRLPAELEKIPPRALRCSLNLPETNIPESVKEEFINAVAKCDSVFRIRVIVPGEINIISLKLNGRILEETLDVNDIPRDGGFALNGKNVSDSSECETDDGKNSKKNLLTEGFMISNLADDMRRGQSVGNETDEEKRVKIAISGVEGFKSDDEKKFQGSVFSSFLNATDSELMEEVRENREGENASEMSIEYSRDDILEIAEEASTVEASERGMGSDTSQNNTVNENGEVERLRGSQKGSRNKVDKIVPGSISRGEEMRETSTVQYQKLKFWEKLVPGSISRGVSLESFAYDHSPETEGAPEKKTTSQSAPNTPQLTRHSARSKSYVKIDPSDRLVPGCISMGALLHCSPTLEKIPRTDKIIPGAVNGSVKDF